MQTDAFIALDSTALSCPKGFDTARLRQAVIEQYERVARAPQAEAFHFHVGADYAVGTLGYHAAELAPLPADCVARYAGVGNPLAAAALPAGATVLDHACGAGMDLLLAARRIGAHGQAIGVDITPGMRDNARRAAQAAGFGERVQILDGSFDALLREAWRVLRPGGALQLADVVLGRPMDELARANPALWAACIGGALHEPLLPALLQATGFEDVRIIARHDCFAGTALGHELGHEVGISSVTLIARKPR